MIRVLSKLQKRKPESLHDEQKRLEITLYHQRAYDAFVGRKEQYDAYILDSDYFGLTVKVKDQFKEDDVAVRITWDEHLGQKEMIWSSLKQNHITSLEKYEHLDDPGIHLFYTQVPEGTMSEIIAKSIFRNNPDAVKNLCEWFREAASGIKHLHSVGLYHLDISGDNIVILDNSAKIQNFHFVANEESSNR